MLPARVLRAKAKVAKAKVVKAVKVIVASPRNAIVTAAMIRKEMSVWYIRIQL